MFERNFTFDSGRKIFNGNFPFICEISYLIQNTENVILKKILDQSNDLVDKLDEKWKEFNTAFAVPIREKFQNGIQFPKENPFEDNDKHKNYDYERSETIPELFNRCKDRLSFIPKRRNVDKSKSEDCSTSANVSPLKPNRDLKEDLMVHDVQDDKLNPEFYDNNYWNRLVSDFDFEII